MFVSVKTVKEIILYRKLCKAKNTGNDNNYCTQKRQHSELTRKSVKRMSKEKPTNLSNEKNK